MTFGEWIGLFFAPMLGGVGWVGKKAIDQEKRLSALEIKHTEMKDDIKEIKDTVNGISTFLLNRGGRTP